MQHTRWAPFNSWSLGGADVLTNHANACTVRCVARQTGPHETLTQQWLAQLQAHLKKPLCMLP